MYAKDLHMQMWGGLREACAYRADVVTNLMWGDVHACRVCWCVVVCMSDMCAGVATCVSGLCEWRVQVGLVKGMLQAGCTFLCMYGDVQLIMDTCVRLEPVLRAVP